MRKQIALTVLTSLLLLTVLTGCAPVQPSPTADTYDAAVPTVWFGLALKLVKETAGFTPPVASRALGYMGVALYETVRPGMPGYQSLAGQLNELTDLPVLEETAGYHWPLAANRALAEMTRALFPTASAANLEAVNSLERQVHNYYADDVDPTVIDRSLAWGQSMADAVFAWSLDDGGHAGYLYNFPAEYDVPIGPGMWVSTPPSFDQALQPYWGGNRPFALSTGRECPAIPPPDYSTEPGSAFYEEAYEVYTVGSNPSEEQIQIARFWADDPGVTSTPPGHWTSILNRVLIEEENSLAFAAEAYAKLGVALADAFITCWYTKYDYNLIRPITYIQQTIDADWNTPDVTDAVLTPPFPEYTSGHSVQSGAAAAVLTELYGDNFTFTDYTHATIGYPPRTYPSFQAAAEEAAISRLYGGIHYRAAIENGLTQGDCVADTVLALRFRDGEQEDPLLVMR